MESRAEHYDAQLREQDPVAGRVPLILGDEDYNGLTEAICRPVEWKPPLGWYIVLGISGALVLLFVVSTIYLAWEGTGIWGLNNPVSWGWAIVNFVFWVGIGHAGTLISAILFLFRQHWRNSINRAAEAMTIFAVVCALTFPAIHVGRIWLDYYMFPLPNQMGMWPNFRSPLMWDIFAVGIYGFVSLLFWYVGLIPDLATLRDRATTRSRRWFYGLFALGWRGSHRHWKRYEKAYLLLAGLATPLVISVHSVVSFDFASAQLPGWHTTIFPPYFVAGAIFSGFAMVLALLLMLRVIFKIEHLITIRHLENMAKIILATSLLVAYAYLIEFFMAWYSGHHHEFFASVNRAFGPYAWAFWTMMIANVLIPQLLWWRSLRTNTFVLFFISIVVNVGMWFERFVITVVSLHRDFLPSSWGNYSPTFWDITTLLGSFGLFFFLFTLFVRFLPVVSMNEVKATLPVDSSFHQFLKK